MKADGYSRAVVALAEENEAHSDDELDSTAPAGREQYLIRVKTGRNPAVTMLFRSADARYQAALKRRRGTRYVIAHDILDCIINLLQE